MGACSSQDLALAFLEKLPQSMNGRSIWGSLRTLRLMGSWDGNIEEICAALRVQGYLPTFHSLASLVHTVVKP